MVKNLVDLFPNASVEVRDNDVNKLTVDPLTWFATSDELTDQLLHASPGVLIPFPR